MTGNGEHTNYLPGELGDGWILVIHTLLDLGQASMYLYFDIMFIPGRCTSVLLASPIDSVNVTMLRHLTVGVTFCYTCYMCLFIYIYIYM